MLGHDASWWFIYLGGDQTDTETMGNDPYALFPHSTGNTWKEDREFLKSHDLCLC